MRPQKRFSGTSCRFIGAIGCLVLFFPVCLEASHDDALRTDLNFHYAVNDHFRLTSYLFIQANDHLSNYDYTEWGAGLTYQTQLPWLSLLAYYQQGHCKNEPDDWRVEYKPSLNLNLSKTFPPFRLYNQIRYEYRFTPEWNDFRIKNYLEVSAPEFFLQPLIGWELFYENHNREVTLNRVKFGVSKKLTDHLAVSPYYRMDFAKNNDGRWEFIRQLFGFSITLKY